MCEMIYLFVCLFLGRFYLSSQLPVFLVWICV